MAFQYSYSTDNRNEKIYSYHLFKTAGSHALCSYARCVTSSRTYARRVTSLRSTMKFAETERAGELTAHEELE